MITLLYKNIRVFVFLNVLIILVAGVNVVKGAENSPAKEFEAARLKEKNRILQVLKESNNADELSKAARQAGEMRLNEAVPPLIKLMKKSDSPTVWHGIGLAVNDLKDQRLLTPLVELIKDKKTKNYRGTLVFGLEGLDCSSVVEWLVDLFINDSLEVRMSVYGCIENINLKKIGQKKVKACIDKLLTAKKGKSSQEDIKDIEELLKLFRR